MSIPSEDVKDLLLTGGFGLVFGTDLFIGFQPPEPDYVVTVFDSGGFDPVRMLDVTKDLHQPTIQVRIRGDRGGYQAARTAIGAIRDFLHGTTDVTLNGTRYVAMSAQSDVLPLAFDEQERPMFSANFRLER